MALPTTPNFDQGQAKAAVDQQKASLLAALAQGGSAMAQQQAAAQQQVAASSVSAAQMAAARAVNPEQASQASMGANGQGAYYAQLAAQQAGAGTATMNTMSDVNGQYMDQLGASIPLAHAQAGREIESMRHAAGQAEAERALRMQMQQMQLRQAQAGAGLDERRLGLEGRRIDLAEKELNARLSGGMVDPQDAIAAAKLKQMQQSEALRSRLNDVAGRQGERARRVILNAVQTQDGMVDDYSTALALLDAQYAAGTAKTPGGKDLDRAYMNGVLAEIYGAAAPAAPAQNVKGGGTIGRSGRS